MLDIKSRGYCAHALITAAVIILTGRQLLRTAPMAQCDRQVQHIIKDLKACGGFVIDSFGCSFFEADDHSVVRALASTKALSKHTVLLRVPPACMIMNQSRPWELDQLLRENVNAESKLYSSVAMLPSLSDLKKFYPLFASDKLLAEFSFLKSADRLLYDKHHSWEYCKQLELCLWSVAITRSYSFGHMLHGALMQAFVPLAFLFKGEHTRNSNAIWYFLPDRSFVAMTRRDVEKGESLSIEYAVPWQSNDHYFERYGFMLPNNPNPVVPLNMSQCIVWLHGHEMLAQSDPVRSMLTRLAYDACGDALTR